MLGLFDDPYRYCDTVREKEMLLNPRHLEIAREVTRKSMVLLKTRSTPAEQEYQVGGRNWTIGRQYR